MMRPRHHPPSDALDPAYVVELSDRARDALVWLHSHLHGTTILEAFIEAFGFQIASELEALRLVYFDPATVSVELTERGKVETVHLQSLAELEHVCHGCGHERGEHLTTAPYACDAESEVGPCSCRVFEAARLDRPIEAAAGRRRLTLVPPGKRPT